MLEFNRWVFISGAGGGLFGTALAWGILPLMILGGFIFLFAVLITTREGPRR